MCRHELPLTDYHLEDDNLTAKTLYGRVRIEKATSFLHFEKKGIVQNLLHQLKYRGHQEVGTLLGDWLGHELKAAWKGEEIDLVIPVPLHKKRQRKRGYNQVAAFGKQLALSLDAQYDEGILLRKKFNKKLAFKKRLDRWDSLANIFEVTTQDLNRKHILLVDDIMTTGATIEACALTLKKCGNPKISVATMAITD